MGPIPFTPTGSLPPLVKLHTQTSSHLSWALGSLRNLYWPTNALSTNNAQQFALRRGLNHTSTAGDKRDLELEPVVVDSGYASAEEDAEDDEEEGDHDEPIQADPMERAFAVRWLTGFIARAEEWAEIEDQDARYELIEEAALLLSSFTAPEAEDEPEAADQSLSRPFSFPTPSGKVVDVSLRDEPLVEDDHTSVGLQSWGAAIVLARRICLNPGRFGLKPGVGPILELGAGTGLLSIVASKVLADEQPRIFATDYHPDVLRNLQVNVNINDVPTVNVQPLDWETPDFSVLGGKKFSLVLAADVVYHPEHALWIKRCVEKVLSKDGAFWLTVAIRTTGRHGEIARTVNAVFGEGDGVVIQEEEFMEKQAGLGRADEGGYRLIRLGWAQGP